MGGPDRASSPPTPSTRAPGTVARRRLRQRPRRHDLGRDLDQRPRRRRALLQRQQRLRRPRRARHLLPERLHARGLGAEADATKKDVGVARQLDRQRRRCSGSTTWRRLPAHARQHGLSSYLDSGQTPIAGQWQHLAATYDGTHRPLLHRRHPGRQPQRHRQRRQLEHLADRRLRLARGRLLRRPDRRRPHLQPRAQRGRGADGHEPAGRRLERTERPDRARRGSTVSARTQTSISLQWTPSTDDVGVTGYNVYLDGAAVGPTAATTFTFTGPRRARPAISSASRPSTRPGTSRRAHDAERLDVALRRASGPRRRLRLRRGLRHRRSTTPPGTATTARSRGATWTSGHDGGALSFNGSNASVDLGALGTFYQSGFTLEAWVQEGRRARRTSASSAAGAGSGPMLWVDHLGGDYQLTLGSNGLSSYLDSGQTPTAGQWQHLAATYDGTHRPLLHRRHPGRQPQPSGSRRQLERLADRRLRLARGRLLRRPDRRRPHLQPRAQRGEVQTDMNQPVTTVARRGHDAADGARHADGRPVDQASVSLSWGAATDNVGVVRYNVHRGDDLRLHALRPRTGSRSRPGRATPTPASPPAPTTTRSPPRTPPATSAPRRTRRAAVGSTRRRRRPGTLTATGGSARRASPGAPPPTTSASPATTSTGRRPPASRPARPTGSRSRPGRATPTPASPPAPTTTRSPPRTPPATSGPPRTRRRRP